MQTLSEEDLGRFGKIYKSSMDNLKLVCEKEGGQSSLRRAQRRPAAPSAEEKITEVMT